MIFSFHCPAVFFFLLYLIYSTQFAGGFGSSVHPIQCHRCQRTPLPITMNIFHIYSCISKLICAFFPLQASIVTVIRLVNDAVDTIENEGTMSPPLCVCTFTFSFLSHLSLVFAVSLLKAKSVICCVWELDMCVKYTSLSKSALTQFTVQLPYTF